MRLIAVNTFRLHHFHEPRLPQYGILSHTWETEEVDYQELRGASKVQIRSLKKFEKIRRCAQLAREDRLEYMWIDTCCIDKSSSAELQEAINSMYRWYGSAAVCYVYLRDHGPGELNLTPCRWTTRCWTLQELIAPSTIRFYARDWSLIQTKEEALHHVAKATGINIEVLKQPIGLGGCSVAEKLSWASKRQCTRIEDQAYSLMGLFGINMPMLYGEGSRAFTRLQEEIVKTTFDMSIFAWTKPSPFASDYCGLLSPTPEYFRSCADVVQIEPFESESPYSVTNLGMQLHTQLVLQSSTEPDMYLLRLVNTRRLTDPRTASELAICVKRLAPRSAHFARVEPHALSRWTGPASAMTGREQIFVRQNPLIPTSHVTPRLNRIRIQPISLTYANHVHNGRSEAPIVSAWPQAHWSQTEQAFYLMPGSTEGMRVAIWYDSGQTKVGQQRRVVLLEIRDDGQRRVAVCCDGPAYIPSCTQEADMDAKFVEMLDWASDQGCAVEDGFGRKDEVEADRFTLEMSASTQATIAYGRVTVDVKICEHMCWDL